MDVNNDGKRDLIYAPNSVSTQYIIEETKQIRWFKNTNTDKSPTWAQQEPLFTDDILDNGNKSNWACADWDKDGDLDCISATNADAYRSKDTADRIYLYENVGTAKQAKFKLTNINFGNIFKDKINKIAPAIADMDNDGKLDLVLGNDKGEILFYKNTSSSANTLNPTFTFSNSSYPGFTIDVGGFSAPAVADIDRDGLKDLVIGRSDSMLSYYRNSGTLTQPSFSVVTNKFGNMKPIDSIGFQYIYDDTFAIIGYYPVYEKNVYSKPVIMDLDGNDTLDIIVGNSLGTLRMYAIDGSKPTSTFKQTDSFYYQKAFQGTKFFKTDLGNFISPCLGDFNGDSVPELIVSTNRGGIFYLKNNFAYRHKTSLNRYNVKNINAYPNPASSQIEFDLAKEDIYVVKLYNSLGQEINCELNANGQISVLNVSSLDSGFYIISFQLNDQSSYTSKFQVIH